MRQRRDRAGCHCYDCGGHNPLTRADEKSECINIVRDEAYYDWRDRQDAAEMASDD